MHEQFNLSAWAIRHKSFVMYLMALVTAMGIVSYRQLAQSEDPPFTFKVMVIETYWPGATALQVQEEVTNRIARKLQETPSLDFVRGYSRPGESQIFFNIKDSAPAAKVPEAWYQVRKKVGDIVSTLPVGVVGPFFNDEFGDVYTNLYALEGDGYTFAQLHDAAEDIRAELLRVEGVGKIDFVGDQSQHIFIELDNSKIANLGLTTEELAQALRSQNAVAASGSMSLGSDRVFVRPTGQFDDVDAIRATVLRVNGRTIALSDTATVKRGFDDPPSPLMRFQGKTALGVGITMQPGGDVIDLGHDLEVAVNDIGRRLPAGLKLSLVTSMPHAVTHAIDDFVEAVAEAIGIVLLVSLVTLGVRTGLVVVVTIPLVLAATAWLMKVFDVGLHKVSLGTLILALGLLVDDAIIAIEMMKVKMEQGWARTKAAAFAYTSTAFPMLTGTLITTAGFLPIALAQSGTGEYTRSIFEVSAISLLVSWLAAVVVVPLLGFYLLPVQRGAQGGQSDVETEGERDVYNTPFYGRLHRTIAWCVRHRVIVLIATLILFVAAVLGFGRLPKQFFPSSDRPELLIDLRLPEGGSMDASFALVERMEAVLGARPEVQNFASFVGSGAPRFYLSLDQQLTQPNFSQFVVTTHDVKAREQLAQALSAELAKNFTAAHVRLTRLENGPPVGFPIQFRVQGPDIATLRGIADEVFKACIRTNVSPTCNSIGTSQPNAA